MNTRLSIGVVTGVLFLNFLLWGCSGGDEGSVTPDGIGPQGGIVTSADGKASVSIPPGALTQETAITVAVVSNPPLGNIGTAYEFRPGGTVFNQPVTISIIYDESGIPSGTNELDLKVGTLVNNQWQAVAGSLVDTVSNKVSGNTGIFSIYGIIAVSSGTGIFSPTGSMGTARVNHAATLLPNGKVLIAGGFINTSSLALASAELYDPASGTFSPTGSMSTARGYHTATLLPNGKVLIVGGFNGFASNGSFSSAELYDPASGSFSPTGSMNTDRESHTATLLSNGKVLIAGGFGSSGFIATAELYDPASGIFSSTGSMGTARDGHTATLLPNSKILIAGGFGSNAIPLASAELYDPASGTFNPTGSMNTDRDSHHTATLLPNGKVLIAGGFSGTNLQALASAELYDPAVGTFSPTGSMDTNRASHSATLLPNGKVLIAGGNPTTAELYDPANGTFGLTGNLTVSRSRHTATLLQNGRVLIAGGFGSGGVRASAELFQ